VVFRKVLFSYEDMKSIDELTSFLKKGETTYSDAMVFDPDRYMPDFEYEYFFENPPDVKPGDRTTFHITIDGYEMMILYEYVDGEYVVDQYYYYPL